MDYNEFKNNVQKLPIIFSHDVIMLNKQNKQAVRNQLNRWHTKGLLIKLRKGIFLLNSTDRKINPSRAYIANQLYTPSYASLEYALNYYGLIPEAVNDLTGITTKKTMRIDNELGTFFYQHVKPETFRGFKVLNDEAGLAFFIAEPEKAVVDFCYLNMDKFKEPYGKVFEEAYRLQNIEILNPKKLMKFAKLFKNNKLLDMSKVLCGLINESKR